MSNLYKCNDLGHGFLSFRNLPQDCSCLLMSDQKEPQIMTESHAPQLMAEGDACYDVLVALRRIIRAIDIQSKWVSKVSGLTPPQVLIMQSISGLGEVSTGRISKQVNLSQATVTTIMDRLEQRGLIERYRSVKDRRIVHARVTDKGRDAMQKAPPLLHERFVSTFLELDQANQTRIINTLEEVGELLGAADIDAAPLLDVLSPIETITPG
jgi:DNA-binding MarR family transcriptional regulator